MCVYAVSCNAQFQLLKDCCDNQGQKIDCQSDKYGDSGWTDDAGASDGSLAGGWIITQVKKVQGATEGEFNYHVWYNKDAQFDGDGVGTMEVAGDTSYDKYFAQRPAGQHDEVISQGNHCYVVFTIIVSHFVGQMSGTSSNAGYAAFF